jgi:hypothetical protein
MSTQSHPALQSAINNRNFVREILQQAQTAEQRGADLVTEAAQSLASFGDVDAQETEYRATKLKSAVTGNGKLNPSHPIALPDKLIIAREGATNAQEHLAAAKAAHASLVSDRKSVEKKLKDADEAVSGLAIQVITAEALLEVAELHQIWDEVWWRYDRLQAITGIPNGAVRLTHDALYLLRTIAAFDHRQFPANRNPISPLLRQSWQSWYLQLVENADAKFTTAEPLLTENDKHAAA